MGAFDVCGKVDKVCARIRSNVVIKEGVVPEENTKLEILGTVSSIF